MRIKNLKGFTLVELMVAIAIIAILSIVGTVIYSGISKSSRDTKRKSDIHAIRLALENYKLDNGRYPDARVYGPRGGWADSDIYPADYILNFSTYLASGALPLDPINKDGYYYSYFRYNPGAFGCDNTSFYVLGVRKFENSPKAGGWRCEGPGNSTQPGPRNWGNEFDMAIGKYE